MFVEIYFTVACILATIVVFLITRHEFAFGDEVPIGANIIAFFAASIYLVFIPWFWDPEWCNAHLMWITYVFIALSAIAWILTAIRHHHF